jgi:hypothetical protein
MAFFGEFQKAFQVNDRKAVASLVDYPMLTLHPGNGRWCDCTLRGFRLR